MPVADMIENNVHESHCNSCILSSCKLSDCPIVPCPNHCGFRLGKICEITRTSLSTFTFTSAIPDCTLASCLITWMRSARYNRSLNHCFLFQITLKNYFAPLLPLPRRNSFVWCWWTPPLTRFRASMPASAVLTYYSDSTGPPILRSVASIIHL